ncbi:hypothetical protein ACFQX6_29220 [Streptosporangium lutulentum]
MKVGYKAVAGTALLAMALTACAGGNAKEQPAAESSQAAQEQAATLPGSTINPVPYDQVADGER